MDKSSSARTTLDAVSAALRGTTCTFATCRSLLLDHSAKFKHPLSEAEWMTLHEYLHPLQDASVLDLTLLLNGVRDVEAAATSREEKRLQKEKEKQENVEQLKIGLVLLLGCIVILTAANYSAATDAMKELRTVTLILGGFAAISIYRSLTSMFKISISWRVAS